MNNFLSKIVRWFKPQSAPKKLLLPKSKLAPTPEPKFKRTSSFKYQRQLIGRLTAQVIAIQRQRKRRRL